MLNILNILFISIIVIVNSQIMMKRSATKQLTILITGESGSGKTSLINLFSNTKDKTLPSVEPNNKNSVIYDVTGPVDRIKFGFDLINLKVIDTVGYGSSDDDIKVKDEIKKALVGVQTIDFVIILFKGDRWNEKVFQDFRKLFGLINNMGFVTNNILPYITKLSIEDNVSREHFKTTLIAAYKSDNIGFMTHELLKFGDFVDTRNVMPEVHDAIRARVQVSYNDLLEELLTKQHRKVYPTAFLICDNKISNVGYYLGYYSSCVEEETIKLKTLHGEL